MTFHLKILDRQDCMIIMNTNYEIIYDLDLLFCPEDKLVDNR